MRPRLLGLLTINCKFAVDFFARGLHTRTAVARLPLRQLGFLVSNRSRIAVESNAYRNFDHFRRIVECVVVSSYRSRVVVESQL